MRFDGNKMRWARDRLGYTLEMVGEEADVSKNSALRAEHGEDIRPITARRIAQALGVEVADLVEEPAAPKAQAPLSHEEFAEQEEREVEPQMERRTRPFDMVHELVTRQIEEDRQAGARAAESGLAQGSFVRHENEAFNRLLEHPSGNVAEAYVDLMRYVVQLETSRASSAKAEPASSSGGAGEDAGEERRVMPVSPDILKRELQRIKILNDSLSIDMDVGEEESAPPLSMDWAHDMEVREYELLENLRAQGILDFVERVNTGPYMTSDEVRLLCRWVGAELSRMHHLTREAVLRAQFKASRDYVEIVRFKRKLDKAEPHEALRQEADAPAEAP